MLVITTMRGSPVAESRAIGTRSGALSAFR